MLSPNEDPMTSVVSGPGKILVVDDDPIVRRFMSVALSSRGFEVIEATNALEALLAFYAGGSAVDLVITDVQMLGISGYDLARMLIGASPSLPVLLVSGSKTESAAEFPFLQKPFTSPVLLEAVRQIMATGRSHGARSA